MSIIGKRHVKILSVILIVSLIGIVVTHPHGTHAHETESASHQHSHSHSHSKHETPDERNHSEFTARLSGTSFVVSFAPFDIVSTTNFSNSFSFDIAPRVFPEFTKQSEPLQSLTRVYLL